MVLAEWGAPRVVAASRRVLIGPVNSAGQGHAWAQAINRHCLDTAACNFTYLREGLNFPADLQVPGDQYRHDKDWADEFRVGVKKGYTHAILESNRPLFGSGQPDARADIQELREAGVDIALLAHGSDVRIPSVVNQLEPWSPFPDLDAEYVLGLEQKAKDTVELFTQYPGSVFVSTVSLLSFVPNAIWCPVVVDGSVWRADGPPLADRRPPIVVHAPSNSMLKGSRLIDPILEELDAKKVIDYRRVSGVAPSNMPALYRSADVVVDQIVGIADYGTAACEAMAAGRIVLGHVSERVRQQVRERTGLELPIIEANPSNISEVIVRLLDDPEPARSRAALGPAYVAQVHDGGKSAAVLAPFLGAGVKPAAELPPRQTRGRVVMLVDNNVNRDSRVQKEARSAAERGWDVTLLGRKAGAGPVRWRLGRAKVQLIDVAIALNKRRHLLRDGRQRSPLAYSRPEIASYRSQQIRARGADLAVKRAIARIHAAEDAEVIAQRIRKASVLLQRLELAVLRRWVDLRATKTRELDDRRRTMDAPLDRSTTKFWVKAMGDRSWRRLDPSLWEWELAYGPVIDRLKPDIIHANDFRMLGVGARAVLRARGWGGDIKLVWDAHEFLPGIKPWSSHPRWHLAQRAHEREYAQYADAVITVSEQLAELLMREHGLTTKPTVVLNAPDVRAVPTSVLSPNLRQCCGVGADVPLLVYSGVAAPRRGLDIMVEALAVLKDVHVALVVQSPTADYVIGLVERATALGVGDRLHVLRYVPVDKIVPFLSGADVGVIPILHFPNHEIALITKFLEYSHARLPIVVSDVKTMAETVTRTGQGEVFQAGNLDDFVRATMAVLADPERYRDAYRQPGLLEQWSWENSANVLDEIYTKLRNEQLAARRA